MRHNLWLNEKAVVKDLSECNKQYKSIRKKIDRIRTEIVKLHDYIIGEHFDKLSAIQAYNLGMIGCKFISRDFPGDFLYRDTRRVLQRYCTNKKRIGREKEMSFDDREELIKIYGSLDNVPHQKLIFLDVDGVLNNDIDEMAWESATPISQINVSALNEIIDKLTEEIGSISLVLSSTWRLRYFNKENPIEQINKDFSSYGIKAPFIGYTSRFIDCTGNSYYRGYEIDHWIKKNCNNSFVSFVIIDDDSDMASLKNQHFRTMPDLGLQTYHYDSILLRMRDKFPICIK